MIELMTADTRRGMESDIQLLLFDVYLIIVIC